MGTYEAPLLVVEGGVTIVIVDGTVPVPGGIVIAIVHGIETEGGEGANEIDHVVGTGTALGNERSEGAKRRNPLRQQVETMGKRVVGVRPVMTKKVGEMTRVMHPVEVKILPLPLLPLRKSRLRKSRRLLNSWKKLSTRLPIVKQLEGNEKSTI